MRGKAQAAAVLLDHGAAQAQAQAHAFGFGGEEGGEELLRHVGRNAGADVGHREHELVFIHAGVAFDFEQQDTARDVGPVHGLHGVAGQVEQDLFDHGAVAQHLGQAGGCAQVHLHRELARLQVDQRQNGVEQGLWRHRLARLVAAAHKVMHAFDDLACALGLLGDALHGQLQIGLRVAAFTQQVGGAGGVARYSGQRLVQLMAEQGGHFAHHGQAGRGLQAVLAGARQLFDAALLAHVQKGAHPPGLHTLIVDERSFDDEHGDAGAVLVHEDGLKTLTRRRVARQANVLTFFVLVGQLGRPVRRVGTLAQ